MRNHATLNDTFEKIIISFVTAWLLVYFLTGSFIYSYTLEQTASQSVPFTVAFILILTTALFFITKKIIIIGRLLFLLTSFIFVVITLLRDTEAWTQIGFCLLYLFVIFLYQDFLIDLIEQIKSRYTIKKWHLIILGGILFFIIALCTVFRYLTFRSADFDLGLFSQMFEYMRTTGLQLTTIERDALMTHFGVHISPGFYLLLPFYVLFPSPVTLQVLQAMLVACSIVPLYLLCKTYHLSLRRSFAIILVYSLYPALSGSCLSDFHENCMLPLFMFFLIWAYENQKNKLVFLFTILSLSIKEDVAILLIFLFLYFIISKKQQLYAVRLLLLSSFYFILSLYLLNTIGDGVLGYMANFDMNGKHGMLQVIQAAILNPGYTLLQCFNVPEKIYYLFFLILPLGIGLIRFSKPTKYIILIPFVLLNFMPDYLAVYTVSFQYHFGITTFLFYILIQNLSEFDHYEIKKWFLYSAVAVSILFVPIALKDTLKYTLYYASEYSELTQLKFALDSIPPDASVCASPKLVPYFYQTKELYPITSLKSKEYIVLDRRPDMMMYEDEILDKYYQDNYTQILFIEDLVEIYQQNN